MTAATASSKLPGFPPGGARVSGGMHAAAELSQADAELLELQAVEARREFLDALQAAPAAFEAYRRWQAAERAAFEGRRARREAEVRES